eukprot:jgi/Antlo1/1957/129
MYPMNWDEDRITSIDLITNETAFDDAYIKTLFLSFVEEFRLEDDYIYRNIFGSVVTINIDHVSLFNNALSHVLLKHPLKTLKLFEKALESKYCRTITVRLISTRNLNPIGSITSVHINSIIRVRGIVVSAGPVFVKPSSLYLVCKTCLSQRWVSDVIPRTCNAECGLDPYNLVAEKSVVSDSQYAKLQEEQRSDFTRHITLFFENDLVNRVAPGVVITVTGIYTKNENFCFIKVLGLEQERDKLTTYFSIDEESMLTKISKEQIVRSIAPSVYGNHDVKKMLACLLFGGTPKEKYNTRIRGSINVLLLGDPGIAKSQMLKFVAKVSPIGVYTSGKGSSAAGLTASVLRDKQGFYLEGGALVLADEGVCCIDEFDKMNYDDQVAIHEAMEQQTISISKAGITTVLNSRTSVLAAANPVFGRYDEFKSPGDNLSFGSTILSRFDAIFLMKDAADGDADRAMARHVLHVHTSDASDRSRDSGVHGISEDILPIEVLRRFIQYARQKIKPVLQRDAGEKLLKFYVETRKKVRSVEGLMKERSAIPITVRQLEAIIRISESLAKMSLRHDVMEEDIDEAIRLFTVSTMNAVSQGHYCEGMIRTDFQSIIEQISEEVKRLLPIGSAKLYNSILNHCAGYEPGMVAKAVDFLVKTGKLVLKDNSRIVVRVP